MINELRGIVPGKRTTRAAQASGFWGKMRTLTVAGACASALWATAPTAHAQVVNGASRKPYALRVGDYIPSEDDAVRAGGTHNLAVEFDYTVQRLAERATVSVLSLGYIERDGLRIIPFTLSQVYREPGAMFLGRQVYFGGGIGIYSVRLNEPNDPGDPKGLFGLHALVGIDVSDSIFVDAKYHYPFHYDRKFVGGVQIGAGVRF